MELLIDKVKNLFFRSLHRIFYGNLRIRILRWYGVKIGERCLIYSVDFSTEPYLIEIGNHVTISNGTRFLTHDGSLWVFLEEYPNIDLFGRIKIGDNTCIGLNCIIMPNTEIGSNCIIGAGSTVRGKIPDNSVLIGNPAKVVFSTGIFKKMVMNHKNLLETRGYSGKRKRKILYKHFDL